MLPFGFLMLEFKRSFEFTLNAMVELSEVNLSIRSIGPYRCVRPFMLQWQNCMRSRAHETRFRPVRSRRLRATRDEQRAVRLDRRSDKISDRRREVLRVDAPFAG